MATVDWISVVTRCFGTRKAPDEIEQFGAQLSSIERRQVELAAQTEELEARVEILEGEQSHERLA